MYLNSFALITSMRKIRTIQVYEQTHIDLKIFAAKKQLTLDKAIEKLLKENEDA